MRRAGVVCPDDPGETCLPYSEMRKNLTNWIKILKPTQVKLVKRWKTSKDMTPSKIFEIVTKGGGEGIVAKMKKGGISYKVKGMSVVMTSPLKSFNQSSSDTYKGKITSLTVKLPNGSDLTVGSGFTFEVIDQLTKIFKIRKGKVDKLYVGFQGYKPAKPINQGGVPSHAQFRYLSTDPEGKSILVGSMSETRSNYILCMLEGLI